MTTEAKCLFGTTHSANAIAGARSNRDGRAGPDVPVAFVMSGDPVDTRHRV